MMKRWIALLLPFALGLFTPDAHAVDPVEQARKLAGAGLEAYDQGDYRTAADKLAAAYQLVRVPTLALYQARALEKLGDWVQALALYDEATKLELIGDQQEVQEQAKLEAGAARDRLLPRVPKIMVQLDGAPPDEVRITIDGETIEREQAVQGHLVNRGDHVVRGVHDEQASTESVSVSEGDTKTVVLHFESGQLTPPPPPPIADTPEQEPTSDNWRTTWGWVGVGVGGAGLAAGGITLAMLLSKKAELESDSSDCVDNVCGPSSHDDVDSYNQLRPISTAAFLLGAAAGTAGVVLLMSSESEPEDTGKASVSVWAGVGSAGVRGRF